MPQQIPGIGEDVTHLMQGGSVPGIGEDVTHLMGVGPTETPAPVSAPWYQGTLDVVKKVPSVIEAALPTAGGIVGGLVGGVPGAAAGGAAGEGLADLAAHATELPGAVADVARNLIAHPRETVSGFMSGAGSGALAAGQEAGTMAAGELVGQGLSRAAAGGAKFLMGEAAKPTLALAREFPDLSETMLNHALTVSEGGLAKARTLLHTTKNLANQALDAAHAAGARVPITAATDGLQKTFSDVVLNSSDPVGSLARLAKIESKVMEGRNGTLTMREADALKTSLQGEARNLYKSLQMGNGSKAVALDAVAKADMAAALNQAIEDTATKAGATGYRAANAAAQDLIGATRAISRRLLTSNTPASKIASEMATPAVGGAVLGGMPGAAAAATAMALGKATTTPSALSRIAIHLNNPGVQMFLRQLPKPVLEALTHLWGATPDSSTGQPQ